MEYICLLGWYMIPELTNDFNKNLLNKSVSLWKKTPISHSHTIRCQKIFCFDPRLLSGKLEWFFGHLGLTDRTKPASFGKTRSDHWPSQICALCQLSTVKLLLPSILGAFLWLAPGGEELSRDGEAVDWKTCLIDNINATMRITLLNLMGSTSKTVATHLSFCLWLALYYLEV